MEKKNIQLSQEQIRKMKHAIGIDNSKVVNGQYSAYRTYYSCENNEEWNEIVGHGLARKRCDPFCPKDVVYHLTKEGIEYLSELLGVKITEQE